MYNNRQEFLKKRYDPVHNRTVSYQKDARLGPILSVIKEAKNPIKLLDIGCYDGHIGLLLKNKFGKQCEAYGIDVANNSIKLALQKGIQAKSL